jgi:hypothetical protein
MPRLLAALVLSIVVAACGTPAEPSGADVLSATASPSMASPASDELMASASPAAPEPSPSAAADALLAVALTDVRTGEAFTLGELAEAETVLLEPMAVWCTTCRAQQHEVIRAHGFATFTSVSLGVDLSESAADLAAYADREGFDWRFALADADLYRLLQDRFGVGVTNPPSTPLIVIEAGSAPRLLELGTGVRDAETLVAELEAG